MSGPYLISNLIYLASFQDTKQQHQIMLLPHTQGVPLPTAASVWNPLSSLLSGKHCVHQLQPTTSH